MRFISILFVIIFSAVSFTQTLPANDSVIINIKPEQMTAWSADIGKWEEKRNISGLTLALGLVIDVTGLFLFRRSQYNLSSTDVEKIGAYALVGIGGSIALISFPIFTVRQTGYSLRKKIAEGSITSGEEIIAALKKRRNAGIFLTFAFPAAGIPLWIYSGTTKQNFEWVSHLNNMQSTRPVKLEICAKW